MSSSCKIQDQTKTKQHKIKQTMKNTNENKQKSKIDWLLVYGMLHVLNNSQMVSCLNCQKHRNDVYVYTHVWGLQK